MSDGRLTVADGPAYFDFVEKWGETPQGQKINSCPSCGGIVGHLGPCESLDLLGDLFWLLVGGIDQPFTSKKVVAKVKEINQVMLANTIRMGRRWKPLKLKE